MWLTNVFSQSVDSIFILFYIGFWGGNDFNLYKVQLIIFSFMDYAFDIRSKNLLASLVSRRFFFSCFYLELLQLKRFHLGLWSIWATRDQTCTLFTGRQPLDHQESPLSPLYRFEVNQHFCTWVCNCTSTICWKSYSFSTELPLLFCQKSIGHIHAGQFLTFTIFCHCSMYLSPEQYHTGLFTINVYCLKIR